MKANSDLYRQQANNVQSYINYNLLFSNTIKQYRHSQIQQKLSQLSTYLSQSASSIEANENSLSTSNSIISATQSDSSGVFKDGQKHESSSTYINWSALFTKGSGKSTYSKTVQYTYKEAKLYSIKTSLFTSSARVNVGDATLKGNVKASLWKDGKFSPEISAKGSATVSLLSGNLTASLGGSHLNATVNAKGSVGAVYANAKAVLNSEEQTLDLGVGAAALRGEVSCSFKIFSAKITLTGQGSVGSAEANVSYSHKNKEWEFGTKLGFIAGLGFKVNVTY